MVGCEPNDEPVTEFRLSPDVTIRLIPASSTKSVTRSATLSDLEIVQQADGISFIWNNEILGRGFADYQRSLNTTPPFLSMLPIDVVIPETGELNPHFIEAADVILYSLYDNDLKRDTIGYIPNATIRQAEQAIKTAYTGENDTAVYALFMTAYKFIPITGEEWRELKDANNQ